MLIVAGEASADRYAARMLRALCALLPVSAFGMGGAELEAEGLELLCDLRRTSAMGTTELLPRIPRIVAAFARLSTEVVRRRPRLAILLDLPDFNLPLARLLAARGVPVLYYVGPQVWAWRADRLREMARTVRRAALVLPFEVASYERAGISACFVGHPILDDPVPTRLQARAALEIEASERVIAVLPGSRPAEVAHHLPALCGACRRLGAAFGPMRFVLPLAPSLAASVRVSPTAEGRWGGAAGLGPGFPDDPWKYPTGYTLLAPPARELFETTRHPAATALAAADLALVATGTATLEAARARAPAVFFHKASLATYLLGRALVGVEHLALPNLLLGRRAIPELWQWQLAPTPLGNLAAKLLSSERLRAEQREAMAEAVSLISPPGAAVRVASMAAEMLQ